MSPARIFRIVTPAAAVPDALFPGISTASLRRSRRLAR